MGNRGPGCFDLRFIAAAAASAVVIVAAALAGKAFAPASAWRIALAVVQAAATAVVIVMPFFQMRRLDEMQRRIQLEAFALAFFATGIIGATWGFLEAAGLPRIDLGLWIWPVMAVLWAAGLLFASRRYR